MSVGAVDVQYNDEGGARAALVVCSDLTLSMVESEWLTDIPGTAPYESGALYKRELPCIRTVVTLGPPLELLIVDGYATLDPEGRPGLGAYAADVFDIPVIGVAKTPFRTATHAIEVVRGAAKRPLYITAAGDLEIARAAQIVAAMAGPYRIPTALAWVDHLARGRGRFERRLPVDKGALGQPGGLHPGDLRAERVVDPDVSERLGRAGLGGPAGVSAR